jgi:hypothetical protein
MINTEEFNDRLLNPIDDNVRQAREYQFSGSSDSALATAIRKFLQTVASIVDSLCYICGCVRIVLLDVLNDVVQIVRRGSGPAYSY